MPEFYSYKITRDYGFAPNPFHGFCTLATCKPHVRKASMVGDWIIGTGAVTTNLKNRLIYLMQVTEKITFEEYWSGRRYRIKKPLRTGSLTRIHGDNIYFKDENDQWRQLYSQHSIYELENEENKKIDLSGKFVLISDYFFYFGDRHIQMPENFLPICSSLRDYYKIKDKDLAIEFVQYIIDNYSLGCFGDPIDWKEYIQRTLF